LGAIGSTRGGGGVGEDAGAIAVASFMTFAPSGVDAMCVGGNSRSDAIRVKGMIACNYSMPIRALSEIDAASMARLASMVTLQRT
jgi:hypothetical protein